MVWSSEDRPADGTNQSPKSNSHRQTYLIYEKLATAKKGEESRFWVFYLVNNIRSMGYL